MGKSFTVSGLPSLISAAESKPRARRDARRVRIPSLYALRELFAALRNAFVEATTKYVARRTCQETLSELETTHSRIGCGRRSGRRNPREDREAAVPWDSRNRRTRVVADRAGCDRNRRTLFGSRGQNVAAGSGRGGVIARTEQLTWTPRESGPGPQRKHTDRTRRCDAPRTTTADPVAGTDPSWTRRITPWSLVRPIPRATQADRHRPAANDGAQADEAPRRPK